MNITNRETRKQFEALSTEIFGVSSKYKKLFQQRQMITRTVIDTIPGVDGAADTTKETLVPVLDNGRPKYGVKHYSQDEVYNILLDFKAKRDEAILKEKNKRELEEQTNKIQSDLSGSAI